MGRVLFGIGAVLGFVGVAAGAFGAHAIRARVTPERTAHRWRAERFPNVSPG